MKVVTFKSPNNIVISEENIPEIKEDEVLIRVKYVGLCGTDLDIYENKAHFKVSYPMIGGHEFSGIIEAVGKSVKYIKAGDRVVGDAGVSCGKCSDCVKGDYYSCKFLKSIGTSYPYQDGAYREYTVMPERHVFKIPDGLSLPEASLVEPSVIARASVEKIGINAGEIVLVSGTGAIGIFAAQYAKLKGAGIVILTGRNDKKLEIAKKTGVDFTINIRKEDIFKRIDEITQGRLVNASIEASGNINALEQIFKITGRLGRITIPGSYDEKLKEVDAGMLASKDLIINFMGAIGRDDFKVMLWLMKLGRIDAKSLIAEIYDLKDIEKAINLHLSPNDSIKTIIRVDNSSNE